jgi:acetylornithine/succinyldiaminopimelate/putrescine aminotransferase
MIGIELTQKDRIPAFAGSEKAAAVQFVTRLHEAGVMTIPSGASVIRLLPPLNLSRQEATEGLGIFEQVLDGLA